MDQRTRVVLVAVFVLLATAALGVQAATIDRGTDVVQTTDDETYPGTTLVGVHTWNNDGRLVEIDQDGEVIWEKRIADSRFFGLDALREGQEAPRITPREDGNVVLFALAEIHPAEECPEEQLEYEASFSSGLDPQDHCILNRVVLMDREADEIVWEYNWYDEMVHWHEVHDATVTDDGQVAIIDMGQDRIFTVDENEEISWEWRAEDHISKGTPFFEEHVEGSPYVDDPDEYAKQHEWDDWTHMNDIDETEDGNFHLSIRNYDMLIEVDPETDEIVDTVGQPGNKALMDHQHNPQHLEDQGTVVVADSGNNRIVEIDAESEEILWEYTGPKGDPLQWPRDADRLPNGNTLITDSLNQRILELNESGETVWSYKTPLVPYEAERLPMGETVGAPRYETSDDEITTNEIPVLTLLLRAAKSSYPLPFWLSEVHVLLTLVSFGMVLSGGTLHLARFTRRRRP